MASLVTAELGTKENPHPYKRGQNRIKGHYYLKGNIAKRWDGKRFYREDYQKEWRENNKERRKIYQEEYYQNNQEKAKARTKEWSENNKERIKNYQEEYRENNKEKIKKSKQEWYQNNQEKAKANAKEYCKNNPEKVKERLKRYRQNNKKKTNQYFTERYHNDPFYRLIHRMRGSVLKTLKRQGASKNQRTMEYINCSVAYLYNHLESQFEPWMTWDNCGVYNPNGPRTWQIDHRKPCDSFDLLNDEEQKYMCFHWTNLQPLCSKKNIVDKGTKFDPKTFRYKWIDRETGWVGIPSYLMNKK